MILAAIGLGSNLESKFGDREANLREAVRRILWGWVRYGRFRRSLIRSQVSGAN